MAVAASRRQAPARQRNAEQPFVGGHPKMIIVTESGDVFVVPYAPRETTTAGFNPTYEQVPRGGRRPFLIESGKGLPTMDFQLVVGFPDWNQSIEDILEEMQELAESGDRLVVRLDRTSSRWRWRLTDFRQQVVARAHGSNDATRAVCDFAFQMVSDPVEFTGPTKGGKKGGKDKKKPKFYTLKKGESIRDVANRYYDNPDKAVRQICDANKIRDPKKVKPGTRLRLP